MKFQLLQSLDAEHCTMSQWYDQEVGEPMPEDMLDIDGFKVWFNKDSATEYFTWYPATEFNAMFGLVE